MDRSFDLSGKVALVPGGTGGLGKVICRGLAKAGADLVIGARNTAQLAKVAEDIHDFGGSAVTIEVDVANQESARAFVDKALQEMNKIDVLVNCAGMTLKKPIVELSLEDWYRVMDVNLTGVFLCSQLVAPIMKDSGGGKIINFCSMGSFVGIRTSAAYCAAKGGLLQLTKVMALEWAPWNIQQWPLVFFLLRSLTELKIIPKATINSW